MRITLALWVCLVAAAHGQEFAFELWHDGKVVTDESDTIKGLVQYNMQGDLLQVQRENRLETFTARKVIFFEIFDKTVNQYRQFFSLPYSASGTQYKAPVFFELLAEGQMTLLCREALEYKTYSSFYSYGSYSRLVLTYKYFLLVDSGEIEAFTGNKNDWIYLMGNKGPVVQKYVKANKLDFEDKSELVRIVTYYNSLFAKG